MRFRNTRARTSLLAAVGVAAVLTGSPVAGAATTQEPPKPGTTNAVDIPVAHSARMRAQDKARSAAQVIRWAVERGRSAGFTGIELYGAGVRLYYRGTPPAAVRTAVAEARRTAPVEIRPATYSLAQLQAASARMVRHMKAHPNGPAHRVSIPVDGSGLQVGVDTTKAATAARSLPDVGVPVRVTGQERVQPRVGRFNDIAPFYGGGKISSSQTGCTAGFGVWSGSQEYLLTAGHCGFPGQAWWNGDGSQFIGHASHEDVGQDLLMIPTNSGGHIFTGVGAAATNVAHVYAWDWVYTGEELCSSGAVTTWLCGHVVIDAGNSSYCHTDPFGTWECYGGLVWSEQEDGALAGQPGDSGGPVALPTTSGIVAKGIISGGGGDDLLWQDFATARQLWGINPVT